MKRRRRQKVFRRPVSRGARRRRVDQHLDRYHRQRVGGAGALSFSAGHDRGRGFTLLESLVAVTILGAVVLAATSAVTAAQKISFEGQKRLLGAIGAND